MVAVQTHQLFGPHGDSHFEVRSVPEVSRTKQAPRVSGAAASRRQVLSLCPRCRRCTERAPAPRTGVGHDPPLDPAFGLATPHDTGWHYLALPARRETSPTEQTWLRKTNMCLM